MNVYMMTVLSMSVRHPEVILKSSWGHHEESDAKWWILRALDKLGLHGRTNEQKIKQIKISISWAQEESDVKRGILRASDKLGSQVLSDH